MSRLRLLQGVARGLAKLTEGSKGQKVGAAALRQASRLKSAAKGAKPIAQQVAREKAKATGKPVRTTIQTAARQAAIQRQAARSAKNPPSGDRLLLQEKGINRTTKNTKLAPGVKSDATKPAPVSRTTRPTKAEQVRQTKSALRDRGQAHVEAQLPKSSQATANQARGNRYSASRNGTGPDPNYGNRPQPKSSTKNNKAEIEGDSRESSRNFARERVAAYNAGDPSARGLTARGTRARQTGAQGIIKDRVANETKGMNAQERQTFKRGLIKQANEGERRVRDAAEQQFQSTVRRDRFNRSPSAARQDHVPAPRDARRISDGQRNKMAEDFGKLPKKPIANKPEPSPPQRQFNSPADHTKGLQEVKKGFQAAPKTKGPATPPPDKRATADFANSKFSQTGRERPVQDNTPKKANPVRYTTKDGDVTSVTKTKLKSSGETSVPKSMGTSQRRSDPSPRQERSDAALRARNAAITKTRSQGNTSGAAAAANRSVDRRGNNLQQLADQALRSIGWSGR